ncbi:MAG TPA: hypothetical protein VEU62_13580 [Bryobacterales bacterium]|nr:hypothetical protein [Bryobacterales bacterium]
MASAVILPLLTAGFAAAQPVVITGGPVNAASYVLAGLPNASIAQGSMFIVFGQNMGPSPLRSATTFPLQANLAGTSIRATVGGTNVSAIMLYTSATQVAAILPSSTPVGDGTLTLTFSGQTSNAVPIRVVRNSIGIFTRNSGGSGPGIVQNFNSQTDTPLNTLVNAVQPGQVMILWGTGLGPVNGDEAAGPLPAAAPSGVTVDVFVGGKAANVVGFGRSGCCAAVDQIAFTVPAGVQGCYVSVAARAGGVISNFATIAVTSSGKICSDPTGFSVADLQKVQSGGTLTVADIGIDRIHPKLSLPGLGTVEANVDLASGRFQSYFSSLDVLASTRGSLGGLEGLPSLGSCVVYPFSYQDFFSSIAPGSPDPVNKRGVDAGATLNFTGPNGMQQLPRQDNGAPGQPDYRYRVKGDVIGGGIPNVTPVLPDFLVPGSFTVDNGSGGAQIGAFRATLTIPSSQPVWTNQDALSNIPRSQDLTVTWSGGASGGLVAVFGTSADPKTGAGASFECTAPADAGTVTVPAWVLSALPVSGTDPTVGVPVGILSLATTLSQPARFQATGIDVGFFNWGALQTKNVIFQ